MALGVNSTAKHTGATALGFGSQTDRDHQVSLGTKESPYSLPGLAPSHNFINSSYQNYGEKRFVTTDDNGTLGTTTFSVDDLVETVAATGALSAALGSIPSTTLLPDENVRCGMGTGFYRSQWAGSIGCAVKVKKRLFLNAGVAVTPTESVIGNPMARVGFSLGFGGGAPKEHQKNLSQAPELLDSGDLIMQMGDGSNTNNPNQNQQDLMTEGSAQTGLINENTQTIAMVSTEMNNLRQQASTRDEQVEHLKKKLESLLNQKASAKKQGINTTQSSNTVIALLKEQIKELEAAKSLAISEDNAQNTLIEQQQDDIDSLKEELRNKDKQINSLQEQFNKILGKIGMN